MRLILHQHRNHFGTYKLATALAGITLILSVPLSAASRHRNSLSQSLVVFDVLNVADDPASPQARPAVTQDAAADPQDSTTASIPLVGTPSQITYKDGQLTIIANNAPLTEVLAALRAAMGADIDLPGGATSQRIWVHLGPGPARKVLRDLLDSTDFNYVIQASDGDVEGIRSVQLTARSKSPEIPEQRSALARGAGRRGTPGNMSPSEIPEPETSSSVDPVPAAEAAQSAPDSQGASALPTAAPSGTPRVQAQPLSAEADEAPIGGSQAQMIQQLQSMYQQRKQIQMEQNQHQKPN